MKKVKYFGILLTMLIIFPIHAKAYNISATLNCSPKTVQAGDTITCTIKGQTDFEVSSLVMSTNLGSNLTFVSFAQTDSKWQGDGEDGYITLYRDTNVNGTFDIGTLTVKVNNGATSGSTSITLTGIKFTEGRKEATGSDVTETITISSAPAAKGLASLTPTVGTFGTQFNSDRTDYMLTLPSDATSFGFTATPKNSDDAIKYINADTSATLDGSNIPFSTTGGNSEMIINIEVGSGSNLVTYIIFVNKNVEVETKGYELSSLKVGDQVVSLISGEYNYEVLLKDVNSYTVEVDLKDRSKFEVTNLISPRSGEGAFTIIIEPKDSSSGLSGITYTINVKSDAEPASSSSKPSSSSRIDPVPVNPPTGGIASVIMAIILAASFGTSIYFYKKNISYLNK